MGVWHVFTSILLGGVQKAECTVSTLCQYLLNYRFISVDLKVVSLKKDLAFIATFQFCLFLMFFLTTFTV